MSSAVDEARAIVQRQLDELDDEAARLRRALDHLTGGSAPKATKRAAKPGSGAQTVSRPRVRYGKRSGSGTRAPKGQRKKEFIEVVTLNPGITVANAAKQLNGVSPSQLYAVAKAAVKSKELVKDGAGYKVA